MYPNSINYSSSLCTITAVQTGMGITRTFFLFFSGVGWGGGV